MKMQENLKEPCAAVVGAGRTKFGEQWYKDPEELLIEAIIRAVESVDLGIRKRDIQASYFSSFFYQITSKFGLIPAYIARELGIDVPTHNTKTTYALGSSALHDACIAIESGIYDACLVAGFEKMTSLSETTLELLDMFALHRDQFNVGFVFSSVFSMMMSKYFHDYARADRRCLEALAQIACKNHHHAINNDYAHLREEITVQDVLESPSLGNPLKRLHCSPISDGAAAVILVGPRLAKKLTDTPIYVVGSQQATCDDPLESRKSTTGMEATRLTISKALKDVKLCIEDIQIAEIHDCFTIEEAMFLEDSGFYGTGKAWQGIYESYESFKGSKHIPYVKDGGMLVVNPSGGLKADGHPIGATGLRQVYECFKQLRQEANKNQVDVDGDLNLAVCHDIGGTGGLATTHILARSIP